MLWSWGWELHPMHVEISPSKLPFFLKVVAKKANLQDAIVHLSAF
jgi:hypothetical protein